MKRIKGKYIRITEEQLNTLIREKVDTLLKEYADPRKEVIKNLKRYFVQLIQNWCLVHYCTLKGEDVNKCKNHWRTELWSIMGKMGSLKLQGNNSYESRVNVINAAENGGEWLTDAEVVYGNVMPKFAKEGINNEELSEIVFSDLICAKDDIISVLARYDKNEIKEYIQGI